MVHIFSSSCNQHPSHAFYVPGPENNRNEVAAPLASGPGLRVGGESELLWPLTKVGGSHLCALSTSQGQECSSNLGQRSVGIVPAHLKGDDWELPVGWLKAHHNCVLIHILDDLGQKCWHQKKKKKALISELSSTTPRLIQQQGVWFGSMLVSKPEIEPSFLSRLSS